MRTWLKLFVSVMLICLASSAYGDSNMEGDANTVFTEMELQICQPGLYSIELAEEKKLALDGHFSELYFELQAFYAGSLWRLLDMKCKIMELDREVEQAELRFCPTKDPENIYQERWNFGAKYFFLRNDIYIERMDTDELDKLKEYMDANDMDAAVDLICITLLRVTAPFLDAEGDCVYEPDGKSAPAGAVVLGLATSPEYDEQGNFVSLKAEAEKRNALDNLILQVEPKLSEMIGVPVIIFKY